MDLMKPKNSSAKGNSFVAYVLEYGKINAEHDVTLVDINFPAPNEKNTASPPKWNRNFTTYPLRKNNARII